MNRLTILASVLALVASGANCGQAGDMTSPLSAVGPSALDGAGVADPAARGGGGGGKKPGSGSGSLTLVMVTDANGDGLPNWGDSVKFNVSTTATTEPYVSLSCSQNGVVVYGAQTGYFASYPWPWTQVMTLSSTAWQGGAADCTAKLSYYRGTTAVSLATLSFTANE